MTHKRIRESHINEVLFTTEGPHGHGMFSDIKSDARTNKLSEVICLGRAYTSWRGSGMYQKLFHTVFQTLAKATNQPEIRWQHIHQSGFHCVKIDSSKEQYAGKLVSQLVYIKV